MRNAGVTVNDHGALDCTIKARIECAYYRGCGCGPDDRVPWGGDVR